MMGYWKDPEATAQVLRHGYYFTGDLGYADEDGYMFVTGRARDMIKVGGNRVSGKEIEDVVYSIPGVVEAAVIGVPDDLPERNDALLRFTRRLADLRRSRLWLRRDTFLKGTRRAAHAKDVSWLHPSGREMTDADWNDTYLRAIAVHMSSSASRGPTGGDLLVVFNADDAEVAMPLPAPTAGAVWRVLFDTNRDELPADAPGLGDGHVLHVAPRSTVLLESQSP